MSMKRRDFITLLGGAGVAWPLAARAQQPERMRRIGVLMGWDENDSAGRTYLSAFAQGLAELGWIDGRNALLDISWGAGDAERLRSYAAELVAWKPEVLVAVTTPALAGLRAETGTIPIVFN